MFTIITESELDRLIKTGSIIVPATNISYEKETAEAIESLLGATEPFEFSEERVLLEYPNDIGHQIDIIDIINVIPIDDNGYRHFAKYQDLLPLKRMDSFLNKSVYDDLKTRYCEQNSRMGIRLFRKYCGLKPVTNIEFENVVIEGVISRLTTAHAEILPEKRNPWVMLLSYDRHEPYEKDSRGFFLDIEEIMWYLKHPSVCGWQDNPIENTASTRAILDLDGNSRWSDMVDELGKNEKPAKLIRDVQDEFKSVYVPLLFLYLKEKLLEYCKKDYPTEWQKRLSDIKEKYSEFGVVATLVGGFMGYENLRKACLGKTLNSISGILVKEIKVEESCQFDIFAQSEWRESFLNIVLKNKRSKGKEEQLKIFDNVFCNNGEISNLNQAIIEDNYDLFIICFEAFEDNKIKKKLRDLFEFMKNKISSNENTMQMKLNL